MMYAFGDVESPSNDTVNVLEDILVEYITDVCTTAHLVSTNRGRLRIEDIRYALRTPARSKQLGRVDELLILQSEITKAKRMIDEVAMVKQFTEAEKAERAAGRATKRTKTNKGQPVEA